MLAALILVPFLAGALAFLVRPAPPRRGLLLGAALAHAGLTTDAWIERPAPALDGWLALDAAGLVVLSLCSALFLAAAVYAVGYLAREGHAPHRDFEEGGVFVNEPEAI